MPLWNESSMGVAYRDQYFLTFSDAFRERQMLSPLPSSEHRITLAEAKQVTL
jgi:hypothetical protein